MKYFKGLIEDRRNGVLVATEQGKALAFALLIFKKEENIYKTSRKSL